jgi:hypothetical protein
MGWGSALAGQGWTEKFRWARTEEDDAGRKSTGSRQARAGSTSSTNCAQHGAAGSPSPSRRRVACCVSRRVRCWDVAGRCWTLLASGTDASGRGQERPQAPRHRVTPRRSRGPADSGPVGGGRWSRAAAEGRAWVRHASGTADRSGPLPRRFGRGPLRAAGPLSYRCWVRASAALLRCCAALLQPSDLIGSLAACLIFGGLARAG